MAGGPVRWLGGQPGSCQPEASQSVQTPENLKLLFYTSIRFLCETVTKNCQTPENKKVRKSNASQLLGLLVGHSSQLASQQALQPAVGQ